ncbi:hypothetical protein [Prochlorococcus marinus]|uniref:Uncharacterized protein n=1 Tax=Prochlorococcus marinus XMU1408 TaxID=2213228 RepID=A0A318R2G4_PROMR|nr:hypothetical protein [Prochlorococcus marinus]MBW3042386.1 hypothetical protein [Prochlorococcus marinus str. XMU1408]PYE01121.1 hypothetical protein DNJ73_06740 [Prochlorococcus marinus XMU1408]
MFNHIENYSSNTTKYFSADEVVDGRRDLLHIVGKKFHQIALSSQFMSEVTFDFESTDISSSSETENHVFIQVWLVKNKERVDVHLAGHVRIWNYK